MNKKGYEREPPLSSGGRQGSLGVSLLGVGPAGSSSCQGVAGRLGLGNSWARCRRLAARPPARRGITAWDLSSSESLRRAVGKSLSDSGHQFY